MHRDLWPCHTDNYGNLNVSRITFLTFVLGSSWVLVGFVMFQECSGSSVQLNIILGMLKIIFLALPNATSCILGRSGLFGMGL